MKTSPTDDEIYDLCIPYLMQEKYTYGEIAELTGLSHLGREMIDALTRVYDLNRSELDRLCRGPV